MKIGVFTLGEVVDLRLLNRLTACLEERFLCKFVIESFLTVPASAYNVIKKQYFAPAVLNKIKLSSNADIKYALGITNIDLYGVSLNFIFGDGDPQERISVVSYYRLRPEFYGHPPKESLLFDRLLKEAAHQLAHCMGLKHCYNKLCVMYYSNNIYDIDRKSSLFCSDCEKRLKRIISFNRYNET